MDVVGWVGFVWRLRVEVRVGWVGGDGGAFVFCYFQESRVCVTSRFEFMYYELEILFIDCI